MKIKTIFRNISPFNNSKDMPVPLYIIKKILAFFFIYGLSAIIGEALIIGSLSFMGYDPLGGVMPKGYVAELLPYYGFGVFFLVAVIYCKSIEKRGMASLGFNKKAADWFVGAAVAVLLISVVAGVCGVTGSVRFDGFELNNNMGYLGLLFLAFFVQSTAEETICRGVVLKSLKEKTSVPLAVFVSSTLFALPHLPSLLEARLSFSAVGIINLYLVSAIFSLQYLLRANIYIVSGMHCAWNFVLNGVMGLAVSGSDANEASLVKFSVPEESIINGGTYGLEASVITTAILAVVTIALIHLYGKKEQKNGLQ